MYKSYLFLLGWSISFLTASAGKNTATAMGELYLADPIEDFWNWFKKNQTRLRNFQTNPDKYLTELHTESQKVQPGLAIELEPPQNGIINMTVSADGDRNIFPVVKAMVDRAPQVEGWRFIAFRQRVPKEQVRSMILKAGDYELNPGQMKFFPLVTGDTLDIIVYTKGITDENYEMVAYRGLLLLDNILGEYDCVMKVRSYDFQEFPVKKEELGDLTPLLELAEFVDAFHASRKK